MRLQEKVARRIADGCPPGPVHQPDRDHYWELVLTPGLRDHFRDLAMEIINLVREETL